MYSPFFEPQWRPILALQIGDPMNNRFDVDTLLKKVTISMHVTSRQIDKLRQCGYYYTFRRSNHQLLCTQDKQQYMTSDFRIESIYEVDLGHGNNYYIYALRTRNGNIRGIFTEYAPADTPQTTTE
jgi:hypothetical protein